MFNKTNGSKIKWLTLYLMAGLYIAAGINHFVHPETYLKIIPPYLPYHRFLNIVSGVLEIGLGLLVLPKQTRKFGCRGLALLLILVFPANIQMAVDYYQQKHPLFWLSLLRLPIQPLLIWWALSYSNLYKRNFKKL